MLISGVNDEQTQTTELNTETKEPNTDIKQTNIKPVAQETKKTI